MNKDKNTVSRMLKRIKTVLDIFPKLRSSKKYVDWSGLNYQNRLKHLIQSEPLATWRTAYIATKHAIKRTKYVNNGKRLKSDYSQLEQALNELRESKTKPLKHGKHLSLRAIARNHHINKSTLYRHYVERYGKKQMPPRASNNTTNHE